MKTLFKVYGHLKLVVDACPITTVYLCCRVRVRDGTNDNLFK